MPNQHIADKPGTAQRVGHERGIHGASPFWDRGRSAWVWVDIEERALKAYFTEQEEFSTWHLPSRPGACAPCGSGRVLVALEDGCYTVELEYGIVDPLFPLEQYRELNVFSSGGLDRLGRFWCTSAHITKNAPTGKLYRLHADLKVFVETETLDDCRGLEWSPDGAYGYMSNAMKRSVDRVDCNPASGELSSQSPFIALRKGTGLPAGLAVSMDGDIWICQYGGACISRWSSKGAHKKTYELPVDYITGCAFGGKKMNELWVTTACRDDLPRKEEQAGGLFHIFVDDTHGVPARDFSA